MKNLFIFFALLSNLAAAQSMDCSVMDSQMDSPENHIIPLAPESSGRFRVTQNLRDDEYKVKMEYSPEWTPNLSVRLYKKNNDMEKGYKELVSGHADISTTLTDIDPFTRIFRVLSLSYHLGNGTISVVCTVNIQE